MRRPPNIVLVIVFFAVGALGGRALRSRAPSSADTMQAKERSVVSSQANPASSAGTEVPHESVVRLKQIASVANANKRARLVAEVADDLDPAQIREALAELDKTHVRERQEITVRLVARWAKLDPKAAIDFAKSIKIGYQRDEVLGAAVKGWMEVDPSAAREWTLALTGPLKDGALRGLMSAMAETDPKAACALVEKIAQRYDYRLAETLFDLWTERAPREAAEHAAKLPKGFLRDESLNVVAERWASNDLPGALAWAETMWDQKISRVEGRSHPSPCDAITNVLQIWMMQDREGALGWINSLSDQKKRADMLGTLVAVEGDRDPVQMTQLVIDGIESGELKNKLIEDIALRWVFRDSAGALKWATELNEPEIQQLVLPRLTVQLSAENAPIAIELAEKVGGAQMDSTIGGALRSWASGDPRAAATWLETRPPNSHYYYSVASSWARKDPEAATDWVNKLSAGVWKDGFVRNAVDQIEPSVGAQWINAISDDQKREEACISLAKRWLERDTEAARAWLANAPFSQKAKDDLLKPNAK